MNVLVTRDVYDYLADTTRTGAREGREFGASLLALEGDDQIVVAHAIPTGPNALQSAGRVRTDADFQNEAIREAMTRVPSLTYVGDWHVHPPGCDALSSKDLATAGAMLADPDLGRTDLFLLLGVPLGHETVVTQKRIGEAPRSLYRKSFGSCPALRNAL